MSNMNFTNVQSLTPISANINSSTSEHKIISGFLSRFINQSFIEKFINVCLYQSDFNTLVSNSNDVNAFFSKFLKTAYGDVNKAPNSYFKIPKNTLLANLKLSQQILQLRDDISSRLITYDNVLTHFPKRTMQIDKLLKTVSINQLRDSQTFREMFNIVVETIQSYNEIRQINRTLMYWDDFISESEKDDTSVFNLLKTYRELVATSYNELSNLTTINKSDQLDDYIELSDTKSTVKVVQNLFNFLSTGYSFYKTGYGLIDENVGGMESSSFALITGPSNHAKSLFMINIAKNVVLYNQDMFNEGDTIVFITLEDDIYKLLRRFISIFGNLDSSVIRQLFIKVSTLMKKQADKDINNNTSLNNEISQILTDLVNNTIINCIQRGGSKCKFIIKHTNENTFSPEDASKFIDVLTLEGYNVKALFIDYVDVDLN